MKKFIVLVGFSCAFSLSFSQENKGNLTGNFETNFQYLNEDSIIGATQPASIGLLNSYMNVFYTYGNFKSGIRLESYLPRIQGYPTNFDGTGLGMKYVGYENDFIDITVGSIYEQFGSGLSLRTYENRALGYDNLLDGLRIKLKPRKGILLKGVYGYQRNGFIDGKVSYSGGIVRAFDGELSVNELFKSLEEKKLKVVFGASFVSKYQADNVNEYIVPENVGCFGGRTKISYNNLVFDGEYVVKGQDPSQDNQFIYNQGHASLFNLTYSKKGFGVILSAKSTDNMSYRSNRFDGLQNSLINYLPSLNKTHTYNLVSSLYPYATQLLGEEAYQGEVLYTFQKGSVLGGKYGTTINVNYSTTFMPIKHTSDVDLNDSTRVVYDAKPFDKSDSLLWRDFNINITKKFSKSFNMILSYYNMSLNNDVATVAKTKGYINSNIFVAEFGLKFKNKQSMRAELQGLWTKQDKGDWATLVIEYTFNTNFTLALMDQYNYGNPIASHRQHHPYATLIYVREATSILLSYGRQRAGLFCVGGVCRQVPASNGLSLTITQSF